MKLMRFAYERVPTRDCDVIDVSDALRIRVIPTPGHTYTHLSFSVESEGEQVGVFSGGSLLFGSTGQPDLLGPDRSDAPVHHQYASAHQLAAELPAQAPCRGVERWPASCRSFERRTPTEEPSPACGSAHGGTASVGR
jgi:glyoxylase-like metal-dependent hydrolase (beta-lactamase superfamily II)